MSFLDPVKSSEVCDARTLYNWAQAAYGVPPLTQKDWAVVNKKAQDLFENVPGTDWQTIVQVIKWCHQNKRRCPRLWLYIDKYRDAWAAHAIDLPITGQIEDRMAEALAVETDSAWRARLMRAAGEYREEVLKEWQSHRENLCLA